ncbi:MAG: Ku protein [Chloroflexi bacterium]|nr:Ku protein [Chloroflexota bacterium]
MARAFWKGAISFGMVAIPVKMYVATRSRTPAFHFLHKKCLTPPEQLLHCPVDQEYFKSRDAVRGFEFTRGQYIVMEDSDLNKLRLKSLRAIQILNFVDAEEIDHIFYRGSHYLEPEQLGVKPFILLREALLETRRAGIAKVTFQRKEHLCALRPMKDTLVLHTLHYADEVMPAAEIAPPAQEVKTEELEMAVTLVNAMTRPFNPKDYKDNYGMALRELVRARVEGKEIKPLKEPEIEVPDLMAALRSSIEATARERAPVGARR